jgi:hypothetical protein
MAAKLLPILLAAGATAASVGASAIMAKSAAKATKPLAPLPTATRDDARIITDRGDELRKRRGTSADILLGASAGEVMGVNPKVLTGE